MNLLLLFFALPIATIILAIVIEKILRCPILTAATFFAIYLIIAFTIFDASFLVFVIVYTTLAFIAALLAEFFFRRCECNQGRRCGIRWCSCRQENNVITLSEQDITRIANELQNRQNATTNCNCNNDIATVNVTNQTTGGRTNWCCYRR